MSKKKITNAKSHEYNQKRTIFTRINNSILIVINNDDVVRFYSHYYILKNN